MNLCKGIIKSFFHSLFRFHRITTLTICRDKTGEVVSKSIYCERCNKLFYKRNKSGWGM